MSKNGFSLLEILVTLLLFSFILLGFDALEIAALRAARAEWYFHIAVNQMRSIKERLLLTAYGIDKGKIINQWQEENAKVLPQGRGEVATNSITIWWGKKTSCESIQFGQSGCLIDKLN